MLCYLLRHYFDHISGIDTVLKNRDNELGCPLLQIFYGTKAYGDIKYALQKFLAQRKAKKEKTIESALELMIIKLVTVNNTLRLSVGLIWNEAINTIPGRLPPETKRISNKRIWYYLHEHLFQNDCRYIWSCLGKEEQRYRASIR
jgi:hypothetical protein